MILREDGYGTVVGRIKDVIIRGGENIFPAEIEEFLMQHPEIIDAQVRLMPLFLKQHIILNLKILATVIWSDPQQYTWEIVLKLYF